MRFRFTHMPMSGRDDAGRCRVAPRATVLSCRTGRRWGDLVAGSDDLLSGVERGRHRCGGWHRRCAKAGQLDQLVVPERGLAKQRDCDDTKLSGSPTGLPCRSVIWKVMPPRSPLARLPFASTSPLRTATLPVCGFRGSSAVRTSACRWGRRCQRHEIDTPLTVVISLRVRIALAPGREPPAPSIDIWLTSPPPCRMRSFGRVPAPQQRRLAAISMVVLLCVITASGSPAWAYDLSNAVNCHYSTTSLKWKNSTTRPGYFTPASEAASAWTAAATPIYFTQQQTQANLTIWDGNAGTNGIVGTTSYPGQSNCGGGHYSVAPNSMLNRHYMDAYGLSARRSVFVHEIGHALGLGDYDAGCSAIMHPSISGFWVNCGLSSPASDDVDGVNTLY